MTTKEKLLQRKQKLSTIQSVTIKVNDEELEFKIKPFTDFDLVKLGAKDTNLFALLLAENVSEMTDEDKAKALEVQLELRKAIIVAACVDPQFKLVAENEDDLIPEYLGFSGIIELSTKILDFFRT